LWFVCYWFFELLRFFGWCIWFSVGVDPSVANSPVMDLADFFDVFGIAWVVNPLLVVIAVC